MDKDKQILEAKNFILNRINTFLRQEMEVSADIREMSTGGRVMPNTPLALLTGRYHSYRDTRYKLETMLAKLDMMDNEVLARLYDDA